MTVELVTQLHAIGVEAGDVLLVHASYRAIRPVDGGPDAVIDALIAAVGPEGTLVMPSWTDDDDAVFDPEEDDVEDHLGIIAETFRCRPDVLRGTHPFAVAAWGKRAQHIVDAPFIVPPHGPDTGVARVHDLDGKVLLLGVDHDADTTIHLAELMAEVPYRRPKHITIVEDGRPKRVDYGENDHCCRNFNLVGDWLRARGLQREGKIGNAPSILALSRDITATVTEELFDDPCRFLCARGSGCEECDDARASLVN